ncbi:MAG: ribosomal-processing cysteine protease Prp [Clostridiales bacterium]|nr:ribosomal-processing cysteine protease Prp [Clostridiales bacterium]
MTNVQILKNNSNIIGFVISGHSGYAEEGSDIVCSAISTLSQSICVGLENVLNLNPIIEINQKKAYLKCCLQKKDYNNKSASILLNTFEQSLNLLLIGNKNYKKYINLEVKNEIY